MFIGGTVSLQVMSRLVRLAQGVYAVHAHWLSIQLRYDKESYAHVARVQKSASGAHRFQHIAAPYADIVDCPHKPRCRGNAS
jgi:hypothetical protein